jgi:hypothetical protein
MQIVKWLAAIATASVLAGCATRPEIPFDKSTNAGVRTIGVVTPSMPDRPTVWLASDVGQSFGLIGALIDVGMQEARDNKVEAALNARGVDPKNAFEQAIEASLKAQGYNAKPIAMPRKPGEEIKTFPSAAESGADAYLDISGMNYGYVAAGIGDDTPYRPFVYVDCRLVSAADGSVLMQDRILYNPVAPFNQGKTVTLSPDPAYTFGDFDTMMAVPDQMVSGIDTSLHTTTDALGRLLR